MTNSLISKSIVISGQVQGVCFRMKLQQKAQELGLNGWVRNTSAGTVEVWASGIESQIEQLIEWAEIGPELAQVENVEATPFSYQPFTTFEIYPDKQVAPQH